MRRNEYDPGMPYDPPPRRRRRPFGDEYDDAWAGGDDDDMFDDGAGYSWEDPAHGARRHDLPEPEIPLSRRRFRRRTYRPPYGSPTYHRDRAQHGEYGEYYEKPKRDLSLDAGRYGTGLHIPFWQILILVILGLTAFLVTMLACVSVLML